MTGKVSPARTVKSRPFMPVCRGLSGESGGSCKSSLLSYGKGRFSRDRRRPDPV